MSGCGRTRKFLGQVAVFLDKRQLPTQYERLAREIGPK